VTEITQLQATPLLTGLSAAWSAVDAVRLGEVILLDDENAIAKRDQLLAPLRDFVLGHHVELGELQRRLLTEEQWVEHRSGTELSISDARLDVSKDSPWADLRRLREQPLVGYLLLLVGEGFTHRPEPDAFTDEIPLLITQLQLQIDRLPLGDGCVPMPAGEKGFSPELRVILKHVMALPWSTVTLMSQIHQRVECAYHQLVLSKAKHSRVLTRMALQPARQLKLIEVVRRDGNVIIWRLTALGLEALALRFEE
jgi:hypothetical protein